MARRWRTTCGVRRFPRRSSTRGRTRTSPRPPLPTSAIPSADTYPNFNFTSGLSHSLGFSERSVQGAPVPRPTWAIRKARSPG